VQDERRVSDRLHPFDRPAFAPPLNVFFIAPLILHDRLRFFVADQDIERNRESLLLK
jgi:hypothetical protein